MTDSLNIAVLGAGSWGTALAALMARHGHAVTLWGRDAKVAAAIDQQHENTRYLPGIPLPDNLRATTDLAASLQNADLVLVVVPSHAFTETLRQLAPLRPASAGVAWATKGFEPGSGRFLHEVAEDILGPVSYTHLDVYKRQPWPSAPCAIANNGIGTRKPSAGGWPWACRTCGTGNSAGGGRLLVPDCWKSSKACLLYTSRCV